MSMFRTVTINCPKCATPVEFKMVLSVNADRRPDLRAAIIDGSFQRQKCPNCGEYFRLDPELSYIHTAHGQWIAAYPIARLGQWKELEEQARLSFDQAYGSQAPPPARELGAGMKPRVTFGWGGLREKLVAVDHQLDDVTLELVKLAIVRSGNSPLSNDTELRFVGVEGDRFVMALIRPQNEQVVETLTVPRQLYNDIVADEEGWRTLRQDLSQGLFVDMNRLLVMAG
jgi:hypothetical protein